MSEKIVQLNEEVIGSAQGTCARQRRGNAQRATGGRGGEADPSCPVRAQ